MPAMRLQLQPDSVLAIDLRATGMLAAFAHDRTFQAQPPAWSLTLPGEDGLNLPVEVELDARALSPLPDDLKASDRALMLKNLHGKEVLHSDRYPRLTFAGAYVGDLERGELRGTLTVRGQAIQLRFPLKIGRTPDGLRAEGAWQGTLSDLGIRPFKALLGAIRLKDWARIRLELKFREAT